jgi:hypothetical protein
MTVVSELPVRPCRAQQVFQGGRPHGRPILDEPLGVIQVATKAG